jgi:hypothetical protein
MADAEQMECVIPEIWMGQRSMERVSLKIKFKQIIEETMK